MKTLLLILLLSFSTYAELSIKPDLSLLPERRSPTPTCINGRVEYSSAVDFMLDFCESEEGIHTIEGCKKYADDVGPGFLAKQLHVFIIKKSRKFCGDKH